MKNTIVSDWVNDYLSYVLRWWPRPPHCPRPNVSFEPPVVEPYVIVDGKGKPHEATKQVVEEHVMKHVHDVVHASGGYADRHRLDSPRKVATERIVRRDSFYPITHRKVPLCSTSSAPTLGIYL